MDLENEMMRAEEAAQLVNHPLFVESFEKLNKELYDAWIQSPSKDVAGRESLWLSMKLLNQTRQHLVSMIETGKMAEVQLSRSGLSSGPFSNR